MCILWDGGWLVYMGGYSIAPKSLRAHKSYVFVKQQILQKRKGTRKEKETYANKKITGGGGRPEPITQIIQKRIIS